MFGRKKNDFESVLDMRTGVLYASCKELQKAEMMEKAQAEAAMLKKQNAELTDKLAKTRKDLEIMFLEAIGNAKTVKQVNAVIKKYRTSSIRPTLYDAGLIGDMRRLADAINGRTLDSIHSAAETKIKRINRELVIKKCQGLDTETDTNSYTCTMMFLLKEVAGKEIDATKIIEAKKAGFDALTVFKSMLAAYNVKQDDVM